MNKIVRITVIVIFFGIVWLNHTLAQTGSEPKPKQIAENLFVLSGMGGNVAFLITTEGVVVVDAGNLPRDGAKITSLVKGLTSQPIRYLIYTHCHGDHVGGAVGFPADVTIIAHSAIVNNFKNSIEVSVQNNIEKAFPESIAKLKADIESFSGADTAELTRMKQQYERTLVAFEDYKKIKIRYPHLTFEQNYELKLGDQQIDLLFKGAGHTNDNIVVIFRNHNIIHAADLVFNGMVPYAIANHGATIVGWQKITDALSKNSYALVIPGHGEIGGMELLKTQSSYFLRLIEDVRKFKVAGKTLDEVKGLLKAADYGLKGNEHQFPVNVEVVYNEI